MELPENWTDVVAPPCSGHHVVRRRSGQPGAAGSSRRWRRIHDRITVVHARRNKRLDDFSGGVGRQRAHDRSQLTQLIVR